MGAIEIRGHLRLRLSLSPAPKRLNWPRIETPTHICTVGCARPLDDALRIAFEEMVYWLEESLPDPGAGGLYVAWPDCRGALHTDGQSKVHLYLQGGQALFARSLSWVNENQPSVAGSSVEIGHLDGFPEESTWKSAMSPSTLRSIWTPRAPGIGRLRTRLYPRDILRASRVAARQPEVALRSVSRSGAVWAVDGLVPRHVGKFEHRPPYYSHQPVVARQQSAESPACQAVVRISKRRSNNPSLKRPDFPVAPEQKSGSRYPFALDRQRVGDEGRGALRARSLCGSDRGVEPSRGGAPVWNHSLHGRQDDEVQGAAGGTVKLTGVAADC